MKQPPTRRAPLLDSALSRQSVHGALLQSAQRFRMARPIDADTLVGRIEGRSRKTPGGTPDQTLSIALRKRTGPVHALMTRTLGRSAHAFDRRQRAVVKIHYFSHGGGGAAALRAHARYIARDAAARNRDDRAEVETPDHAPLDGRHTSADVADSSAQSRARTAHEPPSFYDASNDAIDGAARAREWAARDRRHFRIIIAPENGTRLSDLRSYVREVMSRSEAALGTALDWVAVDHWDTDNPHSHVILRGRHEDGRDLVIPRPFVSHGFREAARDVATERLGVRSREDARLALRREVRAHRPTRLDLLIAPQLDRSGSVRIARLKGPARAPDLTDALKARAHELKRLGLATETRRNVLAFAPDWRERLTAMELHLDIRKSLLRSRSVDTPARQAARSLPLLRGPDR